MSQSSAVFLDPLVVQIELPAPDVEVLPGLAWGAINAFPTPAYWSYQVLARRIQGMSPHYRLGKTLAEEVAACLLGGHGIPAQVGLAAFEKLRANGALERITTEEDLARQLGEPLVLSGRQIRYRFARQKARYLSHALKHLREQAPPVNSGRALRDALLCLPGVGLKTASWVARNWLDADDVAILDIHILRAGLIGGIFARGMSVERHYLELESRFLEFSRAIGVRPSELDAVIWLEMKSSPSTVSQLLGGRLAGSRRRTDERHADTYESTLLD